MAITVGRSFANRDQRQRAVEILARSLVRELRDNGYTPRHIVGLSTELIGLIAEELRSDGVSGAPTRRR